MRKVRTEDEKFAIAHLKAFLERKSPIEDDDTITDKPDWVFSFNKQKIAVECSLLGVKSIFEWLNYKGRISEKNYKLTYYFEPHLWIQKILEKKAGLALEYKKRANSDQVWLLIHTEKEFPFFDMNASALWLMQSNDQLNKSNFDEIWFCHTTFGIVRIWQKNQQLPNINMNISNFQFPQCTIIQGNYPLTRQGPNININLSKIFQKIDLKSLKSVLK